MKYFFILMVIIVSMFLYAEGGYQYLYIDNNPVTLGRGEAGGVFSYNFNKNPANSYYSEYFYLYANHTEYFMKTRFENLGLIIPLNAGKIGVDIKGLYTDNILKTDTSFFQNPEYYKYYNMSFATNYSNKVGMFQFGANVKMLYSNADTFSSVGYILDFGLILFPDNNFNLGISFLNTAFNLDYMPLLFKISPGYKINNFNIVIDGNYYFSDNNMIEIAAGVEYDIKNILLLRAGYLFNSKNNNYIDNFRGGLAIALGPITINYSSAYFNDLGLTHYIGFNYNYSKTIERNQKIKKDLYFEMEKKLEEKELMMCNMFLNKAKEYLDEKNYKSAMENIELALIWSPNNSEAELLKEIIEKNKIEWEISSQMDEGIDKYVSGDYLNAIEIFSNILKIDAQNEKAVKYLNKTKSAYEKSIAKNKTKDKFETGVSYYSKGNYLKAKEIFENIYNTTNDNNAKKYLELVNRKIEDYVNNKIALMEKQLKKKNYSYVLNTGKDIKKYNYDMGKINSIISKATNEKKVYIADLLNKAIEKYNAKNYKKAEEYFNKIIVIDSLNKDAGEYLTKIKSMNIYSSEDVGDIYLKGIEAYTNNDYRLAIKYWEQCLDINPSYSKAKKNIDKAKKKLSELENL